MASRYCRPTDIVTSSATVTVETGTESTDAHYQRPSLYDLDPSVPMKFTTTGPCRLVFAFGSPQHLDAVFLPNHNLDPGLNVRVQGNSSNSWSTPALDVPLLIRDRELDGHCLRPWVNLARFEPYEGSPSSSRSPSGSQSPSSSLSVSMSQSYSVSPSPSPAADPSYQYWSIYLPTNSTAPQLGEVILVSYLRQFIRPLTFGVARTVSRGYIPALETEYGVKLYYDQNVKTWLFGATIKGTTSDLQSMHDLLDACRGPVYPFVFVLDDSVEWDGGYFVRCTEKMAKSWVHKKIGGGTFELPLEFEELSRGLPLYP